MVLPNPNMMSPPPVQPQGAVPIQPQGGGMPPRGVVPPRGGTPPRGVVPPSRLQAMQDYAKMASQDPSKLVSAMKGAQPKGLPAVSPKEAGTGIGDMAPNGMSLVPESTVKDFKLHDVLKHLAAAAASSIAQNLDPETVKELAQSTEPVVEETEDVTIDEEGIGRLGRQLLGNRFAQFDKDTYKGMGEEEIRAEAATGGGLMGLAAEDEFSGIVEGEGHGMEDNIRIPIKEEGEQTGVLAVSPKEYVVDAYTMSALGNGNPDEGADIMDEVVENIREEAYGTREQPNEIDGLASLQSMMERV